MFLGDKGSAMQSGGSDEIDEPMPQEKVDSIDACEPIQNAEEGINFKGNIEH